MNKDFENINFKSYMKFVLPTIFSMVFMSIYTMVDGIFVSRKLGSTALAAINISLPAMNFIFGSIFMIVVGASAIIGINLGEKKIEKANENFSNMLYALIFMVLTYLIVGIFFTKPIARLLGAEKNLLPYVNNYLTIIFLGSIGTITQIFSEVFLRLEGKFNLSLCATVVGGISNIVLDYIFIYQLDMGIKGAALGTTLGASFSGLFGIIYFAFKHSKIRFVFTKVNFKFLKESMINGSSEMVSSLSAGITTFLFNRVLLNLVGEVGVSSITIVLYVNFLLSSIFIGISMGIQPILSYNFGAKQINNINKLLKMSGIFISIISVVTFALCNIFKIQLISLFNSDNLELIKMTSKAFTIISFGFFISGFNILGSSFFTSLNNGKYSGIIAFSRSIIFKSLIILTLPTLIGLNGVWLTIPLSEYLCVIITIYFYRKVKNTQLAPPCVSV
ncbi:multidrug efflux MATE transporter CdeA [Clostridium sediminicola]|uniref:MATE family efflux transporter n=1 Tax=Clostridium sediminicola TaxID=3114879 RepID=UPI0031F25F1E